MLPHGRTATTALSMCNVDIKRYRNQSVAVQPLDPRSYWKCSRDVSTTVAIRHVHHKILQRCRSHCRHRIRPVGSRRLAAPPGLGWQTEHVLAYFVVTSIVCLVWPRPFVVGPALMAASPLLEALQALTPDRHANFQAGLYGAGGALAAALLAELFIRAWRWRTPLKTVKIAGGLAVVAFAVLSLVPWELRPHTAPENC